MKILGQVVTLLELLQRIRVIHRGGVVSNQISHCFDAIQSRVVDVVVEYGNALGENLKL